MKYENLTCEAYLDSPALQEQLEQQARRERAAAVHACIGAAAAALRGLVHRALPAASARPAAL